MKVGDVITVPVKIEGELIYELIEHSCRDVNLWSASVQDDNGLLEPGHREKIAETISHAVDNHDALVGLVHRMKDELESWCNFTELRRGLTDQLIKEAEAVE